MQPKPYGQARPVAEQPADGGCPVPRPGSDGVWAPKGKSGVRRGGILGGIRAPGKAGRWLRLSRFPRRLSSDGRSWAFQLVA